MFVNSFLPTGWTILRVPLQIPRILHNLHPSSSSHLKHTRLQLMTYFAMANCIKQHSLSRRTRSQSPQVHPSSQTTTPSRRATSQSPRVHLLSQTTIPSKRTVVLYNFLVSCHRKNRGAVESWTVFNLTLKEHQALWSLLEKESSLYDYVVGKLR